MWIVREFQEKEQNLPVFYKRFNAGKNLQKCIIKVSALGIFNLKINGVEIEEYFMPGWTNYNKYVHLCTYDLTKYAQAENLLEITLSDGWYSGRVGYIKKGNVYGKDKALYAQLILTYEDGSTQEISTDETWRVGESNIVSSSLFDGEYVDFCKQPDEIDSLPFAKAYACDICFEDYAYEPTKKVCVLTPDILYKDSKVLRLDFKQNFAGFISFTAEGERGAKIVLRHAEVLNPDGTLYYDNLRSVLATDTLVLSGGKDFFDPKFTFHGFRYAELSVEGDVNISGLSGVVLSQEQDYHGKFHCSDEIVNAVYRNAQWGQKGNFISIPTDCPQRDERLGWTGDSQVFCNSAMFNCDCNRFFSNYLKLIRTDILPDGKIPSFVPFFIPVSDSTAGVPGWADAICVIPYTHYLHYRDKSIIQENLPYAVRHLNYYLEHSENYRLRVINTFGDWLSVERADDLDGISQCFLGLSASLISKMYTILDDADSAAKYAKIFENAKRAFREDFLQKNGVLTGDSQTLYALALSVGYVRAEEIRAAFLRSVKCAGGKLTTGFIGVKYLLPALCEIGETDLAYKIIKETEYPSWGYTIKNGATTIWERWNGYTQENGFFEPSMNSFNHYSLGSCVEWLYSHVLGIKLSQDAPICISPSLSAELSFAEGEYKTVNGKIHVRWDFQDGAYRLEVRADEGVTFDCDFKDRQVLFLERQGNVLRAQLK